MNKIVYLAGVYFICVNIHYAIRNAEKWLDEQSDKRESSKNKKGPIGIHAEPAHKPLNRIGFCERD